MDLYYQPNFVLTISNTGAELQFRNAGDVFTLPSGTATEAWVIGILEPYALQAWVNGRLDDYALLADVYTAANTDLLFYNKT